MGINKDCEFYEYDEIERSVIPPKPPLPQHNCLHPDNKPYAIIHKPCNTNNDYCPYNPNNA